uniref:Metastasis-associated protein MTA1 R1 domain-containing protein n=1 Tax=Panthera tigris altaica TaxID=74533 RepID=A0A8C9JIT4_PANTA
MKTRQAFYLHTTKLTRIARRLCREILRPWHAARHPYMPINSAAIKAECEWRPPPPLACPWQGSGRPHGPRPAAPDPQPVGWKRLSPPSLAGPEVALRAPKSCGIVWGLLGLGWDHGRTWPQVSRPLAEGAHVLFSPLSGLANHGQTRHMGPSRNLLLNGKSYPTKVRLIRGGSLPPVKRRRMNWIDAPDDVFYMATEETRWGPPRGWQGPPLPGHLLASLGSQ